MQKLILLLIKAYQLTVSPYLGQRCRFTPSCSRYAAEAVRHHGVCGGGWLAIKRLARCHPLHAGGDDPVPPRRAPLGAAAAPPRRP